MQPEPFLQLVHRGSFVEQTPDGIYHVYKDQNRIAHRARRIKDLENRLGAGSLAFIGVDDQKQADLDILLPHNDTWYMVLTLYNRLREELSFTVYDLRSTPGVVRYEENDLNWVKHEMVSYLENEHKYRLSFITGSVKWME